MTHDASPGAPTVGTLAPSLRLPLLGGGEVDLAELAGRTVLVTFLRHAG